MTLEFEMALIDPDSIRQEPDIPDLELPGTFVFEGKEFDRAVRAADLCSDHIAIGADVDDRELVFDAQGDTDDVQVTLDDEDLLNATVDEDCRSLFSLDYLKDMRKPIGAEASVTMRLGSEMPFKLRYYGADGKLTVKNLLAPRISSED